MTDTYKIAIVGAATIRGKELNEVLAESLFANADFSLLDDESRRGQLEAIGDEVTFIQRVEPSSFDGVDFVFFAGSPEATSKYWQAAQRAGASIIDLSDALENEPGVLVGAPWLEEVESLNLTTPAVIPAHPVSVALALLLARLQELASVRSVSATVLEPASEYGSPALDELHHQTVGLLNFQTQPKVIYDTQVAFNIAPVTGAEAKVDLRASEARIRRHYALLAGTRLPMLPVQLLHAPVFHGHGISLAVDFEKSVALEHVEATLSGEHIDIVMGDSDSDVPNNLNTVGQSDVMVRVRAADGGTQETSRFWIWASIDNLKFSALNAVATATELRKLRPQGKVQ
ncbi:MAG TPA: Asd/ArgC dimerization domain-containing protein [Acidobacteriaceae bacterium]|nr:Asd/ArgC dimerization domain-containing protein [Acidobacteriaceae bacterium]